MNSTETSADLVKELLRHRRVLHAYLQAIVRDPHLTEDLFQEVSVLLLRKVPGPSGLRDFWAWAREVARREALAALRKKGRAHACLSPQALDAVDRGFEDVCERASDWSDSLRRCMDKLPRPWRRIVDLRYWMNLPVSGVASRLSKTENTVSVTLSRIRLQLADCVRRQMSALDHETPGA